MIGERDESLLHNRIIWYPWGDGPAGSYNPIRVSDRSSTREWLRDPEESVEAFRWRIYDELVAADLLPAAGQFPICLVEHHGAEVVNLSNPEISFFKK